MTVGSYSELTHFLIIARYNTVSEKMKRHQHCRKALMGPKSKKKILHTEICVSLRQFQSLSVDAFSLLLFHLSQVEPRSHLD